MVANLIISMLILRLLKYNQTDTNPKTQYFSYNNTENITTNAKQTQKHQSQHRRTSPYHE